MATRIRGPLLLVQSSISNLQPPSNLPVWTRLNIELACPSDFIPELPGWRERSKFIARHGALDFYHYDPYSQALAKIERGHARDLADVDAMLRAGMVDKELLLALFRDIEPLLIRYPALDPAGFRTSVTEFLRQSSAS